MKNISMKWGLGLLVLAAAATAQSSLRAASLDTFQVAQALGAFCQTRTQVCPLPLTNGNPTFLPVGTPCNCNGDPGFVRQ